MARDERGQTASEYLGILLIVAVIIAALAGSGIPDAVADGIKGGVCKIAACSDD